MFLLASTIFLGACSHNIQLTPPLDDIRGIDVTNRVGKNVGYYISEEDKKKEVTTPGGGGDDVSYFPYQDTEAALNTILSKVFSRVYSIKNINDVGYQTEKNISYIVKPVIKTDSSSSSFMTWPPTKFTFDLSLTAVDLKGNSVWQKTVSATGEAEFDEFKSDFSLSARRATDNAFQEMLHALINAKEF